MSLLKNIILHKRKEVDIAKEIAPLSELKKKLKTAGESRNFLKAFKKNPFVLIAEIKRKSPSEGDISNDDNLVKIAQEYEKGGAGVISILTDKKFFNGDIEEMPKIKSAVSLPILRKDFIIDEYQIYESKAYGADAILLIARALSKQELERFIDLAHSLSLECLIEIHDEQELQKVLEISEKVKIIGVNNRNLDTLKTDLGIIEDLMRKIPNDKIIISESGIENQEDARKVKRLGVNGILTGTSLMKSKNRMLAVKNLLS